MRAPGQETRRSRSLQERLLAWFRANKADLPWRRTRDPYAIWVSEIMLQQTQVATVIPYYERFLKAFPTVRALAAASEHDVLKLWQGLGYYRRAINLRAAARQVVAKHGGRVPDDPAVFAGLPGIGRYTCAAVQSIAFGRPLAVLDGNAIRVFARWFAISQDVTHGAVQRELWEVAQSLVPQTPPPGHAGARHAAPLQEAGWHGHPTLGGRAVSFLATSTATQRRVAAPPSPRASTATQRRVTLPPSSRARTATQRGVAVPPGPRNNSGDWNQAIMELGREVCTPREPRCPACPLRTLCLARRRGIQGRLPVKRKKKPVPHIEVGAGIVWRRGRILLCKRRADAMLGGLWEFPGGKRDPGETIPQCIRRELREECDLDVAVGGHLVDVTHTYSHLRVTLRCYHCRAGAGRVRRLGCDDARWVRPQEIPDYPLPAADVRILEALGVGRPRRRGRNTRSPAAAR
jgi:mutator protein MutT